jgi:hypothetical protein
MLQAGRSLVLFPMRLLIFFQLTLSFQPQCGLGVDSDSNRNEYQESSWGGGAKGSLAPKTDNLTAICEAIVEKVWEPRRFTTLWDFTASYRDSFSFKLVTVAAWSKA